MSTNNVINRITLGLEKITAESISAEVFNIAKSCIIDTCGVAIAGSTTRSARNIHSVVKESFRDGNCTVLGNTNTLNVFGAAVANGASAHALDFDDNCYAGIVHGSAVVLPSVLAVAQENSSSGNELLSSFIAGLEAQFAVAKALSNNIYDRGWWTTSILGVIGSAAGACKLLNLNREATSNALALAIVGGGATRSVRGTDAKHYYCGLAAERGITAAKLALNGATGPLNVFEDFNGITKVLNGDKFERKYIDMIGKEYCILKPGMDIKKYPVCYASHAAIDGVKELIDLNNINSFNIKKIICTVPPVVASNLTFPNPVNRTEAQFSLEYAIATIIEHGSLDLTHLEDKFVKSSRLKRVSELVYMNVSNFPKEEIDNKFICPEWAEIEIMTNDGMCYKTFVGAPVGSANRPLPEKLLYRKFSECLTYAKNDINPKELYERLLNIDQIENSSTLFD